MKIIANLRSEIARFKELIEKPAYPALVTSIKNAERDWKQALTELNHIDNDLAEYVIFKINAAERRYMALLEQAKKEGVAAWSGSAVFTDQVAGISSGNMGKAPCSHY